MLYLKDIKFVDLKKSEIDKEKSNPDSDEYVFKRKVYWKPLSEDGVAEYFLSWNRKTEKEYEIRQWKAQGWTFIEPADKFWPEPLKRESNNRYEFGDAVAMKLPMQLYLQRRQDAIQRADRAPQSVMNKFKQSAAADGVDVSDADIAHLLFGQGKRT